MGEFGWFTYTASILTSFVMVYFAHRLSIARDNRNRKFTEEQLKDAHNKPNFFQQELFEWCRNNPSHKFECKYLSNESDATMSVVSVDGHKSRAFIDIDYYQLKELRAKGFVKYISIEKKPGWLNHRPIDFSLEDGILGTSHAIRK